MELAVILIVGAIFWFFGIEVHRNKPAMSPRGRWLWWWAGVLGFLGLLGAAALAIVMPLTEL